MAKRGPFGAKDNLPAVFRFKFKSSFRSTSLKSSVNAGDIGGFGTGTDS